MVASSFVPGLPPAGAPTADQCSAIHVPEAKQQVQNNPGDETQRGAGARERDAGADKHDEGLLLGIHVARRHGELDTGEEQHDAQYPDWELPEDRHERVPEHEPQRQLADGQEHHGRAAPAAEPVLPRQPARAVAARHGAEPAADEIHEADAHRHPRRGKLGPFREQIRRELAHRNDRVEHGQGKLRHGTFPEPDLEIVPGDPDEPQRRRPEAKASQNRRVTHEAEHEPEREHDERRRDAAAGAAAATDHRAVVDCDDVLVVAGARGEDDEEQRGEREDQAVEAEERARRGGGGGGGAREVLDVADVLDGGEGEGEALRELDAAHDGEREEAVDARHEARGAEEQQDGGDREPRGHDLRDGEVRGGERDGGDRLHGLHGHRDAEEQARGEVVERREDERRAEVQVRRQRQREHDRDVGAQVAHRAAQLGPHGCVEADA